VNIGQGSATKESLKEQQFNVKNFPFPASAFSNDDKLKLLINQDNVMVVIVIKGSRSKPRCRFSKVLVSILYTENISYSHFDIDGVRSGLKIFSDWPPTNSQLYEGLGISSRKMQQK
jgi:glutaredoxin-related protein